MGGRAVVSLWLVSTMLMAFTQETELGAQAINAHL